MNITYLNNPAWHALNSHHRHLAIWGKIAVRYQPGIFVVAAMPDYNLSGFSDLRDLFDANEIIGVMGAIPEDLPGWEVVQTFPLPQMICENLKPATRVDAIRLTQNDVPEMLDLIALAQPGPFMPRTIEMGQYLGLRENGQLVAMAGERMHMMGFCEISAVCTHPDYRGHGYAGALVTLTAETIIKRGEQPFLHVASTNDTARTLYEKLGFCLRTEIQLSILKKLE